MARYIKEDEFIAWVKEHWCADCQNDNGLRCRACWIDDAIDIVEEAPEADVVTKNEVERLQAEIERLKKDNEYILMQHRFQRRPSGDCWNDVIEKAKAEVAREIFVEIEKAICGITAKNAIECTFEIDRIEYIELKKKYTEGASE